MSRGASHNRANLCGQVFGYLTVTNHAGTHPQWKKSLWRCECKCGKEVICDTGSLRSGNTESCGCRKMEIFLKRIKTHGESKTRTYRIWRAMITRCTNPNQKMWSRYGGRGIKVCERWLHYENFILDMGKAPKNMSIDRIDNNGMYEKENCRWSTNYEQSRNSSKNRVITFNRRTMILKDWADEIGINQTSLAERLEKWPLERALTQKPRGH